MPDAIEAIRKSMEEKSTKELMDILQERDTAKWSAEAFQAIDQILTDRAPSTRFCLTCRKMSVPAPDGKCSHCHEVNFSDPAESPGAILTRIKPLTPYGNTGKDESLLPEEVHGRFLSWSFGIAVAFAILTIVWRAAGFSGFFLNFLAGMGPFLILADAARSLKSNWPRYLAHVRPPRLGSDSIRRRQATARIILRVTPFLIGIVLFANGQFFGALARLGGGKSAEQTARSDARAELSGPERMMLVAADRAKREALEKANHLAAHRARARAVLDSLQQASDVIQFRGGTADVVYHIKLKSPWTRDVSSGSDTFTLGDDIKLTIEKREELGDIDDLEKVQARSFRRELPGPQRNLHQSKITLGGREWITASFEYTSSHVFRALGTEDFDRYVLEWLTRVPSGTVALRAALPARVSTEYEPAVREAFDGFSLLKPAEMDEAILATLDPGTNSRVHRGSTGESIQLGSNWQRSEDSVGQGMSFNLGEHASIIINLEAVGNPHTSSIDDYVNAQLTLIRDRAGETAIENRTSISIAGNEWVQLRYRFVIEGKRYQATAHYHVTRKRAYQVVGITGLETAAAHDRVIMQAVESLKFP